MPSFKPHAEPLRIAPQRPATWGRDASAKARALLAARGFELFAIAITLVGLALRIEHALTFDGPLRGSDYGVYVQGARWMSTHWRPFNFTGEVSYQVRYQPPFWYFVAALILRVTGSERAVASLSVAGFLIRQVLLAKILARAAPGRPLARGAALALHTLLPLGVLIDGKVNPEGTVATLVFLAVYALFTMEREASAPEGIRLRTAAAFGLISGLAVLAKGTGVTVVIAAALFTAYQAGALSRGGVRALFAHLLVPMSFAAIVFVAAVGWWCVPNIQKYNHPFPHEWDLDAQTNPVGVMAQPALYRRPLGWTLPFELSYYDVPVIRSPIEPRPNFWGVAVAGTWADFYNRGFCRLQGGEATAKVWGGTEGFMSRGTRSWDVTQRCISTFRKLTRFGLGLSVAAVAAVFYTLWSHLRSTARRGSFVLPVSALLAVLFVWLFALTYPMDSSAVLNPRYLLPASGPMLACFGIAGGRLEASKHVAARVALNLACLAIATIGALLVYERFGR